MWLFFDRVNQLVTTYTHLSSNYLYNHYRVFGILIITMDSKEGGGREVVAAHIELEDSPIVITARTLRYFEGTILCLVLERYTSTSYIYIDIPAFQFATTRRKVREK